MGNSPIDIAGFCGKENIVVIFAQHLADKIQKEMEAEGIADDDSVPCEYPEEEAPAD